MKETTICSVCGAEITFGKTGEEFQGEYYCNHCLAEKTVICECCNERVLRDDAVEDRVCRDCYTDHYYSCHNCGALIYEDDVHYIGIPIVITVTVIVIMSTLRTITISPTPYFTVQVSHTMALNLKLIMAVRLMKMRERLWIL